MGNMLKELLMKIQNLNNSERLELRKALDEIQVFEKVCDLIEKKQDQKRECPYCNNSKVYKHGTSAGFQRYKCCKCSKTFNSLTRTPLAHLRKKKLWLDYINCMLESKTIRKSCLDTGINIKTSFRWRHRFTQWLCKDVPTQLNGIVEADETYFDKSKKGCRNLQRPPRKRGKSSKKRGLSKEKVCVLSARDRSKESLEYITGTGPVKAEWLQRNLSDKIASDALLITDGLRSYDNFCKKNNLDHEIVESNIRCRESFHIQNVNSYHSRLKNWIIGIFHGVATKYLNHYLWWLHELENKSIYNAELFLQRSLGEIPQFKGT